MPLILPPGRICTITPWRQRTLNKQGLRGLQFGRDHKSKSRSRRPRETSGVHGRQRRQRETTADHGRQRETTGDHGRQRETTGDHGILYCIILLLYYYIVLLCSYHYHIISYYYYYIISILINTIIIFCSFLLPSAPFCSLVG